MKNETKRSYSWIKEVTNSIEKGQRFSLDNNIVLDYIVEYELKLLGAKRRKTKNHCKEMIEMLEKIYNFTQSFGVCSRCRKEYPRNE